MKRRADPPAQTGCTSCVVNDLDLTVKTATGTSYPNGRTSRDSVNTVERITLSLPHGAEFRVIVHARNFATSAQPYSLAITGCFSEEEVTAPLAAAPAPTPPPTQPPTRLPTPPPTQQQQRPTSNDIGLAIAPKSAVARSCPLNALFEIEVTTANDGDQLSWNFIKSLEGGGVERIFTEPSSSAYENNRRYVASTCLSPSTRYRFQLRNQSGESIQGRYKLTYRGSVIFNSQWAQNALGRTSTFRFKTDSSGGFDELGSNSFAPHIQTSESAEIKAEGLSSSGFGEALYDDDDSSELETQGSRAPESVVDQDESV